MNALARLAPGPEWTLLGLSVFVQVTGVVLVAGMLARALLGRHGAARHGLWLGALVWVLASPLIAAVVNHAGLPLWSVDLPLSRAASSDPPRPAAVRHDALPGAKPEHRQHRLSRAPRRVVDRGSPLGQMGRAGSPPRSPRPIALARGPRWRDGGLGGWRAHRAGADGRRLGTHSGDCPRSAAARHRASPRHARTGQSRARGSGLAAGRHVPRAGRAGRHWRVSAARGAARGARQRAHAGRAA